MITQFIYGLMAGFSGAVIGARLAEWFFGRRRVRQVAAVSGELIVQAYNKGFADGQRIKVFEEKHAATN